MVHRMATNVAGAHLIGREGGGVGAGAAQELGFYFRVSIGVALGKGLLEIGGSWVPTPRASLGRPTSPLSRPPQHTRGVSFEKSKAPNGWTYGDFIILVFPSKNLVCATLTHDGGSHAPRSCRPTWFYNYQSLWGHRKPGPEPPWPPSLWPLGATRSASCFGEGWVLPALFWELGGVLGSLHQVLATPPADQSQWVTGVGTPRALPL